MAPAFLNEKKNNPMRSANKHFILFVLLTIISGFIFLHSYASYQNLVLQGDHGRSLYSFWVTSKGATPFRDYYWVYGPLMPYYYALFMKCLGPCLKSVLLAKIILQTAAGTAVFCILSLFIPGSIAYLGALWFWAFQPDFHYTYNHIGGIVLYLWAIYLLFYYFKTGSKQTLFLILPFLFLLSLVKINFGLASFFAVGIAVLLYEKILGHSWQKNKFFYLIVFIAGPLSAGLVQCLFLWGLPAYFIRHCMPFLSADRLTHTSPVSATFIWAKTIIANIQSNRVNSLFSALIILGLGRVSFLLARNKIEKKEKTAFLGAVIFLSFYYFLLMHEYLISGVLYRTYWAKPISTLLIFLILGLAIRRYSALTRMLFCFTLLALVFLRYQEDEALIRRYAQKGQFFSHPKMQVTIGNNTRWITTVTQTADFIHSNLTEDETFLALPYDPLYYFLTEKQSPVPQLVFFEYLKMTDIQQERVIQALNRQKVNYLLISSLAKSGEPGLGVFGQTHCVLLGKYFEENFTEIAQFGEWQKFPRWAWNHGTKIYKRVDPL